jgi:hypothetical protein
MKVLLLCGNYLELETHPALLDYPGESLIDQRIGALRALGLRVCCVLSGPEAEEILKKSKRLEQTELVFDTNDPRRLASHLRSGLFATHDDALVLPIHIAPPPRHLWLKLRTRLANLGPDVDIVRPYIPRAGRMELGFPWLVSRRGAEKIRSAEDTPDLDHLREYRMAILPPAESSPSL